MAIYPSSGQPHVVVYSGNSGYLNLNLNCSDHSCGVDELWNTHWSRHYSLMAAYQSSDQPHVVVYSSNSGYLNLSRIDDSDANTHWSKVCSLMALYPSSGQPRVVVYSGNSGYLNRIDDSDAISEARKDHSLMVTVPRQPRRAGRRCAAYIM